MVASPAPAALPALLFVLAVLAASSFVVLPIGGLACGCALGIALGGRRAAALGAVFLGLLIGGLERASEEALARLDPSRPVAARGQVASSWRRSPAGWSGRMRLTTIAAAGEVRAVRCEVGLELPATATPPPAGAEIRVRGYLTRSRGFANQDPAPPGRYRLRCKSAALLDLERPPPIHALALEGLRRKVREPFAELSPHHPGVAFGQSLLLGEVETLEPGQLGAFRRLGLAHLLAVSGMNVALIAGLALTLGAYSGPGSRLVLVAAGVLLHLALVGSVPSLARATGMALLLLGGRATGRPIGPAQGLSLAAASLVAWQPDLARELGFQLSCAATAGLIGWTPWLLRRWGRRSPLANALAVSLAAQAATLPIVLAVFSHVAPLAPLLNLLAVPLASLLVVAALFWVAVALSIPPLGEAAANLLDLIAWPLAAVERLPAGGWFSLPLPPSWLLGVVLSGLLLAAVSRPGRGRGCVLAVLCGFASPPAPSGSASDPVELVAPDVGQGQGLLLRRGRQAVLIDGGGVRGRDLAIQVWLPLLARRGIGALTAVAVTHPDFDHCGGLVDVAAFLPIGEIWAPERAVASECVRRLRALSGAALRSLTAGDRLEVAGLRFAVLGPPRGRHLADNDLSLVLSVEAEGRRLLLTGDIERSAETLLVGAHGTQLRCDLLQVPHHGGARSSSVELLAAAAPRIAWIAAGAGNRFGHPARSVLERLRRPGRLVLRTDRHGELVARWKQGSPLRLELPSTRFAADGG